MTRLLKGVYICMTVLVDVNTLLFKSEHSTASGYVHVTRNTNVFSTLSLSGVWNT